MTDTPAAHPTDPFDAEAPSVEGLHPVDPAYAKVLRIATALNLIPLAIGASVFDALLIRHIEGPYGLITALAWLIAIVTIVSFPSRRVSRWGYRSEERTSELQSLMRISYAVFCLKKKKQSQVNLYNKTH